MAEGATVVMVRLAQMVKTAVMQQIRGRVRMEAPGELVATAAMQLVAGQGGEEDTFR